MKSATNLYALCADPASAQRTVDALRTAGVRRDEITVISSQPLDDCDLAQHEKSTLMPWIVALGAVLGGIGGFLLVSLTQRSYPIVTGGMPIVPAWTDGIITYELTMLGAILTTVVALIVSAPLLRWKQEPYDAQIAEGKILVGVVNPSEHLGKEVAAILQGASTAPAD